jgi:hypothetical protein
MELILLSSVSSGKHSAQGVDIDCRQIRIIETANRPVNLNRLARVNHIVGSDGVNRTILPAVFRYDVFGPGHIALQLDCWRARTGTPTKINMISSSNKCTNGMVAN